MIAFNLEVIRIARVRHLFFYFFFFFFFVAIVSPDTFLQLCRLERSAEPSSSIYSAAVRDEASLL